MVEPAGKKLGPDTAVIVQMSTLVAVVGAAFGSVIWGAKMDSRQGATEKWQDRQEKAAMEVADRTERAIQAVADSVQKIREEMADGYVKWETLGLYLELLRARNHGTIDVPTLPERR